MSLTRALDVNRKLSTQGQSTGGRGREGGETGLEQTRGGGEGELLGSGRGSRAENLENLARPELGASVLFRGWRMVFRRAKSKREEQLRYTAVSRREVVAALSEKVVG